MMDNGILRESMVRLSAYATYEKVNEGEREV